MDTSIYCVFENSKLKSNFVVCKYCQFVATKPEGVDEISRICPVLLHEASQHPAYSQITLDKVTIMKQDGTVVSEQMIEKNKEKPSVVHDWWFGQPSPILKPIDVLPSQQTANKNKKQCSQEQIDQRMEICKGCEFYKNNTCLKCGCALSRERNYMNKLLWADQSCPVNKWGPVSTSS
jgi:hypothetical protein